MFKRIFSVILVIAMVASLAACAGAAVPAGVDEDGRFVYSVVRSGEKVIPVVENAAKSLRSVLKENFECNITIAKDNAFEDFDGNYEILIGDTNREESAKAKQRILDNRDNNASDFIVAVIDDKICITAVTDEMVGVAVDWFIENFCDNLEAWSKLTKGYEFIYAPGGKTVNNTVNGVNLGLYSVVLPRKTSLLVGMGADKFIKYYTDLGYNIVSKDDFLASDETEYEILFGDTVREASKSVNVEGDNYVIKVVGKKLVVKGGTHLATWRAAERLFEEIEKTDGQENGFSWPDGHTINGKYDATEKGTYTLNWYDEFESTEIDLNKWGDYRREAETDALAASCLGGLSYTTNVFDFCRYTGSDRKKLVYQADGCMVNATQRVNEVDFIGSRLSTYWTMTFKYCVMDIYGKLPDTPAHASYWVNGASTGNPGGSSFGDRFGYQSRSAMTEIDILENFGAINNYAANVHRWYGNFSSDGTNIGSAHNSMDGNALYGANSPNNKRFSYDTEKYGDNMVDDFHMYSYYWDDERMMFAFDGKVFCDYKYSDNLSVSVHCLMNYFIVGTGMGSPSYGVTYNKSTDADYLEHKIDYIRIYQTDAINSQLITAWPQKQATGESKIFYPENSVGGRY